MKATVLIKQITKLMAEHGDIELDVSVPRGKYHTSYTIDRVSGPWLTEYDKKTNGQGKFHISVE